MRSPAPISAAVCLAALCLAGCLRSVEVSHSIQPTISLPDKLSEKAGVVCSDELLSRVERGGAYKIELGEPLCAALVRSVESTYRSAQRAVRPPYKGEFGRVIRFDLQSASLGVEHVGGGVVRVTCSISVVVQRFGRDMKPVSSQAAIGNALVERSDRADVLVREAAEAAMQQVADNASTLLVAGLGEPRQHGTGSPAPP